MTAGGWLMPLPITTDRLNMAVYSRLFVTGLAFKSVNNTEGSVNIIMYSEFLILVVLLLIIKRLEKLDE